MLLLTQIVLFLTDSNNSFLFIQCSYFYICLYHFFLRFVFFAFLFLFSSTRDTLYKLTALFDLNSLQPAFDFKTCGAFCDLVPCTQLKKREKHPWRSITSACNFTKSNTPPWVIFMFFKSYEWSPKDLQVVSAKKNHRVTNA